MSITMESRTDSAPSGWYPDPAGSPKLRFWNGTEWTNRLERRGPGIEPVFGYDQDGRITRKFDY
jgi:Protein of unknown function (DUF2510)